jgi:hypothetical protein
MNRTTTPADTGTARLIDLHAETYDITDTRVALVDADPASVLAAARRLELTRSIVQAMASLGVADHLALFPMALDADGARESVYGMVWRVHGPHTEGISPHELRAFERPGYVKVIWDVRVEAGGESGTILSTTTRFVSTDQVTRERLAEAWGIVGPASKALATRGLAAIKRSAEGEPPSSGTVAVPFRRQAPGFVAVAA